MQSFICFKLFFGGILHFVICLYALFTMPSSLERKLNGEMSKK